MIISASRRTDIPAFYSTWFMNGLRKGFILIPNPRNPNRLGRVELTPENIDCIVFWTKNPFPMLERFPELTAGGYSYYIQFTLTPYEKAIEPNLPPKKELLQTFINMSDQIGARRAVWRYDPIIIDTNHSVNWHLKQFAIMSERLHGYTERCIISFVDPYKSLKNRFRTLTESEMMEIASGFAKIACKYNIDLYTCAEEINLLAFGIKQGACIDQSLIEEITGYSIIAKGDANQRAACRCIQSVDIGAYDTCSHGCTYCYATSSPSTVLHRMTAHDPHSPMISGHPRGDEIITNRTTSSQKSAQISLF